MRSTVTILAVLTFFSFPVFAQSDWPMGSRDREQTSWAKDEHTLKPPFDMHVIQFPAPIAGEDDPYSPYVSYSQGMLYFAFDDTPNRLIRAANFNAHRRR